MIYLLNNTDPQEIYIPKNTSGVNPHKSNSYWAGFEDGYESGETHQKNFLSSVTFTENGEYERENGWSAVTVDVPQTGSTAILEEKTVVISADTTSVTPSSGYDGMSAVTVDASSYAQQNYDNGFDEGFTDGYSSGNTDGYESGYTSGHTDGVNEEKDKLSATTFTANTTVTISDGGYSAITVNVPQSGYSINDLAFRNYTINNPSITASTIEESAFEGCSGLTGNLELGSSVCVIKEGAFSGSSISEIIWPQNIDGGAFSVTSMTMMDGCQFAECQNLEYVEVPNYVTFSGSSINASSGMFYSCQNLVNVDYYASRIPTNCFQYCIKLEYIYIDNITSIGQKAFYGCTHLTSIRFAQQNPPTVSYSDAFSYVPSGGTLYVPFGRSSAYQSYLNYLTNWTIVEDAE